MDGELISFLGLDIFFIFSFIKFFDELDTFWFVGLLLSIVLLTSLLIYKIRRM